MTAVWVLGLLAAGWVLAWAICQATNEAESRASRRVARSLPVDWAVDAWITARGWVVSACTPDGSVAIDIGPSWSLSALVEQAEGSVTQ